MKIEFREPPNEEKRRRLLENVAHSKSLGLPYVGLPLCRIPWPLAVVGGGTSVRKHLETLKNWPGDIWAINGAWRWCRDNDIDAAFFSVDPAPGVADLARGAKRAFLGSPCHPDTFAALADTCMIIRTPPDPAGIYAGPTTATYGPEIGARCGFQHITFFGCESSYEHDPGATRGANGVTLQTHTYMRESVTSLILVKVEGEDFLTEPEYLLQALWLSNVLRAFPQLYAEESGGLLRALIQAKEWDYDIIGVSQEIAEDLWTESAGQKKKVPMRMTQQTGV